MRREDDLGDGEQGRSPDDVGRRGPSPKWIGIAIGAVALLIFAIQNGERTDVDFFVFDAQVRVVVVILVSALLGFAIGWLIGRPGHAERKAMRRGMDD